MALGVIFALTAVALVIAYCLAGYGEGMFWPSQVMRTWGKPGIALAIHGGAWGDLFFLPLVAWYVTDRFDARWGLDDVRWVVIGFLITLANHINLCLNQRIPDPFGWQKEWWSLTVAIHFLYMWGVSAILLKAAFTPDMAPDAIALLAIVVGIHMMFGTHMPLGIINRFARWDDLPEFLTSQSLCLQAGLWVVFAGLAWYLGDIRAAVLVALVGGSWIALTNLVAAATKPVS